MLFENAHAAEIAGSAKDLQGKLREVDRRLRGRTGQAMGGQSPGAALQAFEDWFFHLSKQIGRPVLPEAVAKRVGPPSQAAGPKSLGDAPGEYVFET